MRRHALLWAVLGLGILGALFVADRAFPPDLGRAERGSVVVVDRQRALLRAFLASDGAWRLPTGITDVDPRYLALLRAYEDRRFGEHVGVDPLAVMRAAWQWARSGHIVSGASTLTMQAARLLEPEPRSLGAKLRQMARALQLEERLGKAEIMGVYLTLAPFGGNLEGVRAASLAYFGKEPRRLSLGEAALLVALPQSPERLRPDRHPEAARVARAKVLRRLQAAGAITATELAEALDEPLPAARFALPFHAPHLAQHLAARAAPGAVVATEIDRSLQRALESLAAREVARFDDGADLAVLVVENRSRALRAYLGGADFFGPHGQIDLARAPRSPGSALKPFIYGLAFDDRIVHPASLIEDAPMRFGDYAPRNFDRQFQGTVSVSDALRASLNVPAVALLDRIGPARFIGDLRAAGATIRFDRLAGAPGLPVALGGLGISLDDLTLLYAALANEGAAAPLRFLSGGSAGAPMRLIDKTAAWYLADILKDSPLPAGYAQGVGLERPRAIAFKTGTSYGFRDAWAAGWSPRYTVGVWVGRADGSPRPGHYGRNTAAPILLKVFDLLPPDDAPFAPPPAEALSAETSAALPPGLRHFAVEPIAPLQAGSATPPHILFPPEGAVLDWRPGQGAQASLPLKAEGAAPLLWVVNGVPLPRRAPSGDNAWRPDGEGFARIAVVDAEGRSAAVRVRVVDHR